MNDHETYSVGEFARLAGVTVRTLHFYDEAGLLRAGRHADNQRREYRRRDLLRLQQILTLKHLGFSLDEVETLLDSPTYDVRDSLRTQKQAIEAEIRRLQGVAFALSRVSDTLEASDEVDWSEVTAIIHGLTDAARSAGVAQYLPPEWQAWLAERAAQASPEIVEEGARAWTEIYADFVRLRHLPPDDARVLAVAARAHRLGALFTGGSAAVEQALGRLYSDVTQISDAYRMPGVEQDLQDYIQRAIVIFREKGNP